MSAAAQRSDPPAIISRMPAPAIVVEGVSKTFERPEQLENTLKERALHPFRRRAVERFDALNDVSFAVEQGEFFGVVGRNGSGKSTLLKLMAGIYQTTAGEIWVRGRTSTFIELGVGFNPDLAARDNVYLNAIMLGLSASEARERYERVIEFAELREFESLKLKNYSSGMHVRLAFSVMVQVDADVLMIDEVLAVGDAGFQQKCFDEFNRLRDEGRTIVLVTHDMSAVRRFCDRAMLLERGRVVDIGEPDRIGSEYLDMNFGLKEEQPVVSAGAKPGEERYGDGRASITAMWLEDEHGEPLPENVPQGEVIVLKAVVEFHAAMTHPSVGVAIETDDRRMVFGANTMWVNERTGSYAAGDRATTTLRFRNQFAAGRYFISPAVAKRGTALALADHRIRFGSFVSTAAVVTGGLVDLDYDMELCSGAERPPVPSDKATL
jgi:ABC-type polysaccharide/polyol phosphate transport system ATPase subunit